MAKKRWEKLKDQLISAELEFHYIFTEHRGQAGEIVADLIRQGYTRIGSFGGDGTVNEVLQGIVAAGNKDVELVFLAAGSSNDFIKKFPDEKSWLEKLRSTDVRSIDYCQVDYQNFKGEAQTRYFINNSSIGVISLAGQYFNDARGITRALKRVSVDGAAIAAGLKAIIHYQPLKACLEVDGEVWTEQAFSNLTIYKTPYFGGGMYYNRGVEQEDGKIAVAQVRFASKLELIKLIPALYAGTVFEKEIARYFECQSLVIHSDQPMAVETDGEILGQLPARYTIIKQGIRVVL